MTISKENKSFIDSLVDYYISEASSYTQFAAKTSEVSSIKDTAVGIIIGCVYSGFLNAYQSQQKNPSLEELNEFNKIMKEKSPLIMKAVLEAQEKPKIKSEN